jgi:glycosyltransferase involved in cell wall biosynthesis
MTPTGSAAPAAAGRARFPDVTRVLIASHYTSERLGGEAAIPLRLYKRLRRRGVEAWLVAHDSDREELTAEFAAEPERLVLTPSLPGMKPVFTQGEKLPDGPRAVAWAVTQLERQLAMVPVIRRLVAELDIDVVHQPIGIAPSVPSPLRRLGAPVVIGPLNGGMVMPPAFRDRDPRLARLTQALRRPLGTAGHSILRGKPEAAAVLVANTRTRDLLPAAAQRVSLPMPESAVVVEDWPERQHGPVDGPVRFVFLGRLVPYKSPDLALHAFARARKKQPGIVLEVIGDGPLRGSLEQLATELGIADAVDFRGWLTKPEVSQRLREADVFLYPSLREPGGTVVLEAMATGLPSIVADWGGPAEYIADGTGLRIDVSSRARFLDDMAEAMVRLAEDPELRQAAGTAARERVAAHYSWDVLVAQLLDIYAEVARR